jgi:hypothetical protein
MIHHPMDCLEWNIIWIAFAMDQDLGSEGKEWQLDLATAMTHLSII